MKTIWKFPFEITDSFSVVMPIDSQFLHVAEQHSKACMWYGVDTDLPDCLYYFVLRGTGHKLDGTEGRFLGTFMMYGGDLIFHLFERKEKNGA